MGMEYLDLMFRLERRFGFKVTREELRKLANSRPRGELTVGDVYEFAWARAVHTGVFDADLDAGAMWPIFQVELSNALGVDPEEIVKDKSLIRDLGME